MKNTKANHTLGEKNTMLNTRIATARTAAKYSQKEFAKKLGLNHGQSISDIEKGKRSVSVDELMKIMEITGKDLNFFTDPFRLAGEGQFSFRAKEIPQTALEKFQKKAGPWLATYRYIGECMGTMTDVIYKLIKLNEKSSFEDARAIGERVSELWKLGDVPARKLEEAIRNELGVLILYYDHDEEISGAACRLNDLCAILIRRQDSPGRRFFDLAHELFHILTWDAMPPERKDIDIWKQTKNSKTQRIERLANNFASALLLPEALLKEQWDARGKQELTSWVIETADTFLVSRVALKWRLVNLGLCKTDDLADDHLCDSSSTKEKPLLFSKEFVRRIHWAIQRGELSVRKAASITDLTRDDLTKLFTSYDFSPPYDL